MKVQKKVSTKLIGFAKHLDGEESYERYLKTAQEKRAWYAPNVVQETALKHCSGCLT